jgi:flotillin
MRIPPEIMGGVAAGLAVLMVLMVIYRYLLRICRPNEILIFSGRKHKTSDGRSVGYRVVFGGRGVRIPLVETVDRMDLSRARTRKAAFR